MSFSVNAVNLYCAGGSRQKLLTCKISNEKENGAYRNFQLSFQPTLASFKARDIQHCSICTLKRFKGKEKEPVFLFE